MFLMKVMKRSHWKGTIGAFEESCCSSIAIALLLLVYLEAKIIGSSSSASRVSAETHSLTNLLTAVMAFVFLLALTSF